MSTSYLIISELDNLSKIYDEIEAMLSVAWERNFIALASSLVISNSLVFRTVHWLTNVAINPCCFSISCLIDVGDLEISKIFFTASSVNHSGSTKRLENVFLSSITFMFV